MPNLAQNLPTYLLAISLVIIVGFNTWDKIRGSKSKAVDEKDKAVGASVEVITIYEKQVLQLKQEKKDQADSFEGKLKEQSAVFDQKIKDTTVLINNQAGQIGELQGINKEKDKQLADYKAIFQGRDPQMLEILTKLAGLMERVDNRLETIEENQGKPLVATTETTITKQ